MATDNQRLASLTRQFDEIALRHRIGRADDRLSRTVSRVVRLRENHDAYSHANEAFDAGEWSGPAGEATLAEDQHAAVVAAGFSSADAFVAEVTERTSARFVYFRLGGLL